MAFDIGRGIGALQGQAPAIAPGGLGSLGRMEAISELARADQERRKDAEAQALLQQLSQQYADKPDEMVNELRRRGFQKQAQGLETYLVDYKKKQFDARKAELDGDLVAGRISAEAAEAERKAMDATSPEKILPFFAAAKTEQDKENAKALARLKFGAKAEPVIAQWDSMTPEFAGRVVMGPEKVAIDEDRDASRVQAGEIAEANRGVTMRGQDIGAATTRRGQDIGAATSRRGQDLTDARAKTTGTDGAGVKLSATAIEKVAAIDQAIGMISDIERTLPNAKGWIGPLDGRWAQGKIRAGATVPQQLADFDTQITALKNAVIKATTGAAMSEPEAQRIMAQIPDLTNSQNVFEARLKATLRNIELLKKRTIELSGGTVAPAAAKADPLGIRK